MSRWSVRDAETRFSELLDTCMEQGPQVVTRRGLDAAVLVPLAEWTRLHQAEHPTLKDHLLAPEGRFDMELLPRGTLHWREPADLD